MATMSYSAYDPLPSRPLSRRQSLAYPSTPMSYHGGYDQGMYRDPRMDNYSPDGYPQPSYDIYGPPGGRMPHRRYTTPAPYDGLDMPEAFYAEEQDYAMTPHSSTALIPRRRHSMVSLSRRASSMTMDVYRRPSNLHIKFKHKGSLVAGVNILDAQSRIRLSGNNDYTVYDLHADGRRCILLNVKWAGHPSTTYEIPLDDYDHHVSLSTLARRVARACSHYLHVNMVAVPIERVELHHLEEITYGTWQPMLSVR